MAELRYNPLIDDYTMVSANRAKRPDMPKDFCPFCAGSGKVPDDYDVLKYDNDFPILRPDPVEPDDFPFSEDSVYHADKSFGKCEVVLYSPNHYRQIHELSDEHVQKLVRLWKDRFLELSKHKFVKYIMPFENRGKEVGTTMPHPHGQIYAYSKMPLRLRLELNQARKYYEKYGKCLFSAILDEEYKMNQRVIFENNYFAVVLPYFCEYPYGCYIMSKEHLASFADFNEEHIVAFAHILKTLNGTFDQLFDKPFPYMMGIYQAPVNSEDEYGKVNEYYQFHVKFFPPLRAKEAIKWCASSETAAWVHGNPRCVEETAAELRAAYEKYLKVKDTPLAQQLRDLENTSQEAMQERLLSIFKGRYQVDGKLFFSPSRINIIGEHIDYNGGFVFPAAIEIGTYGVAIPNGIDKVRLKSLNVEGEEKIALDDLSYQDKRTWMNYATGMLKYLKAAGYKIGGLDILVYGNIPNGSGLSSSASLELLIGSMQNYFFNDNNIPMLELVKIGKQVENEHIGVQSGIMDQFAIGMGKKDSAILLNTSTLDYSYFSGELKDATFVIMNTNKRRELAESKYNERRSECDKACDILVSAGFLKSGDLLCKLNEESDDVIEQALAYLLSADAKTKHNLSDEVADILYRRVRHVLSENKRVSAMTRALAKNDIIAMGQLLNESHYSLRDDYEVTGLHLDEITQIARAEDSCYGARMTGAGFGGCALALVAKSQVDNFITKVGDLYKKSTGIEAQFFISGLSDGPRLIK